MFLRNLELKYAERYFLMLFMTFNLLINMNYCGRRSQVPRVYNADT